MNIFKNKSDALLHKKAKNTSDLAYIKLMLLLTARF